MIHIEFQEPDTKEWRHWRERCAAEQEAHNRAVESGRKSAVKPNVYGAQKRAYVDLNGPFHGKCAYCEKQVYSDQHGDLDHFRPKGAVTDEAGKPVMIERDGHQEPHPGYYWLAYDWSNLLPSCILCNRPSKKRSQGRLIGKHDRFPVAGPRASRPSEEQYEEPLLLNPACDRPEDHLELDESGLFCAKNNSERGRACIRILALNERGLPGARKAMYSAIRQSLALLAQALVVDPNSEFVATMQAKLQAIKDGTLEFGAAARKAVEDARRQLAPLVAD